MSFYGRVFVFLGGLSDAFLYCCHRGLKKRTVTENDVSAQELQSALNREQEMNEEDPAVVEAEGVGKGLGFKQ